MFKTKKYLIAGMAVAMLAIPSVASAAPAKDFTGNVVAETATCGSGPNGTLSIDKGIATFGLADTSAYGVIRAFNTGDMQVKDLKTLSFKSKSSAGGGMVYMNVVTDNGHGGDLHKIKYVPFEQAGPEPGIGAWYTHDLMASGARFEFNGNEAFDKTWADAVSLYGPEKINRVSITAGCALGSGTVQVDRFQINNSVIGFNK